MADANIVTIPDNIIEYRTNKGAKEDLPKSFLVQFVNGRQTEYRRCFACGTNIKCKDSNSTGLRRHRQVCNGGVKMISKENCPLRVEKQQKLKTG